MQLDQYQRRALLYRTAEAFQEAKAAIASGKRPEDAWPTWYIQGKNPPRKRVK